MDREPERYVEESVPGNVWGLLGTALGTVTTVAVTILGGVPLLTSLLTWSLPLGGGLRPAAASIAFLRSTLERLPAFPI